MKNCLKTVVILLTSVFLLLLSGCNFFKVQEKPKPRLSLFIGVDISGSFLKGEHFDDSMDFLAHYIYAHLHGYGGLEEANALFVGSIGGGMVNEAKTFYPKQTFEDKSVEEIAAKLREIFPKTKANPFTDYNAFFQQVERTIKNKNLVLRPISIVMISDGIPDVVPGKGKEKFDQIQVKPLENLARSVTLRLLYTDAVTGAQWQTQVKRRRVKIWTQDAKVMAYWKDPAILAVETPMPKQEKFLAWVQDNVDFGVRSKRVD